MRYWVTWPALTENGRRQKHITCVPLPASRRIRRHTLWYGEHLLSVGRMRDALEENLIAYQLDPLHLATNGNLAWAYLRLGDTHNAVKYGAAAADLGYAFGMYVQTMANFRLGEFDRAIELAEQYDERFADQFNPSVKILKLVIEAKWDTAKRPLLLETLAEHESRLRFRFSLPSYVEFGQIDDAYRVTNLRRDSVSAANWWNLWRDDMTTFRQDPRFAELVTELGLLDYWREYGWPDACQPAGDGLICE